MIYTQDRSFFSAQKVLVLYNLIRPDSRRSLLIDKGYRNIRIFTSRNISLVESRIYTICVCSDVRGGIIKSVLDFALNKLDADSVWFHRMVIHGIEIYTTKYNSQYVWIFPKGQIQEKKKSQDSMVKIPAIFQHNCVVENLAQKDVSDSFLCYD